MLQLLFGGSDGGSEGTKLRPPKNFRRAVPLDNALIDLGHQSFVSPEISVVLSTPQAIIADHVRYSLTFTTHLQ